MKIRLSKTDQPKSLPYHLQPIGTLSAGRTLAANQAPATANADLVGQIAVALARLSANKHRNERILRWRREQTFPLP